MSQSNGKLTPDQLRRIQTLWGLLWKRFSPDQAAAESREGRLSFISGKVGRRIESCKDLTRSEAVTAIRAIQACLPAELVQERRPVSRDQAKAYGTHGRRGGKTKEVRMTDGETLKLLNNLAHQLGWNQERLDAFLRSPKSPTRGSLGIMANANRVIWALKGMLGRRDAVKSSGGLQVEPTHLSGGLQVEPTPE